MLHASTVQQRARLPLVAVAAFGLGVLATLSAPRLSLGTTTPLSTTAVPAVTSGSAPTSLSAPTNLALTVRPAADSGECSRGDYVTGDLAGDASPATIYATMCGK